MLVMVAGKAAMYTEKTRTTARTGLEVLKVLGHFDRRRLGLVLGGDGGGLAVGLVGDELGDL